jgi:hypothetical protein
VVGRHRSGDATQASGEPALVFAITAQVEHAVLAGQWRLRARRLRVGLRHPARSAQRGFPFPRIGPFDRGIAHQLRTCEVEAGVPLRHGGRSQRRTDEHAVVAIARFAAEPAQALRERVIERTQGALAQQGVEQAHAVASASMRDAA